MSTATLPADAAQPSPLAPPPNFPVTWDDQADARQYWQLDRMFWPAPVNLLDFSYMFEGGRWWGRRQDAWEGDDLPVRWEARRINTYYYQCPTPMEGPTEELAARRERAHHKLQAAIPHLGETWRTQFLPEIERHFAYWQEFDLQGATMPQLLAHLDETLARSDRIWDIHFLVVVPAYAAISMFDDLYGDLFGRERALDSYRLLQGFGNKTVEMGLALWQLSRAVASAPAVQTVLQRYAPGDVPAALEQSAEGRAFQVRLRAYLREYGQRSERWGISYPSWVEDPTPVMKNLRDYAAQPERDPHAELSRLASERERLVTEARARLAGAPAAVVERFELLLKAAQEGTVLHEDHAFWIDFGLSCQVRQVAWEFGRRFAAAGVVAQPDSIFHLTLDELRQTAEELPRIDRRALTAARCAEIAYFRTITPPAALGTPPAATAGPPTLPSREDPVGRAFMKMWGLADAGTAASEEDPAREAELAAPRVLYGNAGSAGVARGAVRVVRTLAEAAKLRPGDVLVAETTAPPWTLLFATAAAVVTDAGGVLSHSAVVAREYGIPAVLGTGTATSVLKDGQIVEVDGSAGTVRVVG